ncbi:hypothetical protein AB0I28_27240 [Phytomonospora sp. NPDC050363]|uniref:hypothetical protein n=1 Tax=Phytomonospora sp. NPDC050363 TaxID=3155642 RepID=UPI0033C95F58
MDTWCGGVWRVSMGVGAFRDPVSALRWLGSAVTVRSSNRTRLGRLRAVHDSLAAERCAGPDIATGLLALSLVETALTAHGRLAEIDDWPSQEDLTDSVRDLGRRLGAAAELPDHLELRRPDGTVLRLARAS